MDHPLSNNNSHGTCFEPRTNQKRDEGEVVLFSRPRKSIPQNPFASSSLSSDQVPGIHNIENTRNATPAPPVVTEVLANQKPRNGKIQNIFQAFSDNEEVESEIEFDKSRLRIIPSTVVTNSVQGPLSTKNAAALNSTNHHNNNPPPPLQVDSNRRQSWYFANETDDDDALDISKYVESVNYTPPSSSERYDTTRRSSESFNISAQNSTGVRREDVIFSSIIFVSHLLSFSVDFSLMWWYYFQHYEGDTYNFKWCSFFTFLVLLIGSFGILQQFNHAERDRLDRLFTYGRRIQILINAFPPIGTIICSYYCVKAAWKSKTEQSFSVQFFAIEEFSQKLSRVQAFFQSAPQALLQLIILMETYNEISPGKGFLIFSSVVLSLIIMTTSNLPGRSDMVDNAVRKGIYNPISRIFFGTRMISSFGSRTMATTYFLVGLRCIFGKSSAALSVVFGICAIVVPRLIFTLIDYCYHLNRVRRGRESTGVGQFRLSFCGTLTGYLATILFPMKEPLWVFYFIWIESVIFMMWGLIVGIMNSSDDNTSSCVSNLVNYIYSSTFLILFIVIPCFLPFARDTVKRKRSGRIAKKIQDRDNGVTNLQQVQQHTAETECV